MTGVNRICYGQHFSFHLNFVIQQGETRVQKNLTKFVHGGQGQTASKERTENCTERRWTKSKQVTFYTEGK